MSFMQLNRSCVLGYYVQSSLVVGLLIALCLCVLTSSVNASTLISGPDFIVDSETIEAELRYLPEQHRKKLINNEATLRELIDDFYRREAVISKMITPELLAKPEYAYRLERAKREVLFGIALNHQRSVILENLPPLEELAEERYLTTLDRFQIPPKIHVRHILLKAETDEEKKKRRAEAEQLNDLLIAGADFGETALKVSEDQRSARQRGDLGWVAADKFVPSFAEAALALTNKGELSEIVETRYGLHIIQFIDSEPARTKEFKEVKTQLISEVREELVSTRLRQWYEDITEPEKMTAHPEAIEDFVENPLKQSKKP